MKDIFATGIKILGFLFAALVIGFTGWLTWLLAQRIIPGNTILQFMTLALFDGGALVWFLTFITQAKGTMQWAVSGVGFLVGLAGAVIMAAGELILGQQLVKIDDPTKIGWILVITVVVAALAHASLIYAYHFSDPATKNRIETAQQISKAIERAHSDARAEIDRNVDSLVVGLVESVLHEARQQIASATAVHIRNAAKLEAKTGETLRGGPVVDGQVRTAGDPNNPPTYTPAKGKKPFGWYGWRKRTAPVAAAATPLPTDADDLTPDQWGTLLDFYEELKHSKGPGKDNGAGQAQAYAAETIPPIDISLEDRRQVGSTYHKIDPLQPGGEYTCPYCGSKRVILNPKQNGREKCPHCGGDMDLTNPARHGQDPKNA